MKLTETPGARINLLESQDARDPEDHTVERHRTFLEGKMFKQFNVFASVLDEPWHRDDLPSPKHLWEHFHLPPPVPCPILRSSGTCSTCFGVDVSTKVMLKWVLCFVACFKNHCLSRTGVHASRRLFSELANDRDTLVRTAVFDTNNAHQLHLLPHYC